MSGVYRVGRRAMTESRVELTGLDAALDELSAADLAFYEQGVLWVRSRVKRLRSKSPKMAISVARDFAKLSPDHPFHARWLALYGGHAWLRSALRDVLQNLAEPSPEVLGTAVRSGDSENLSGASREPLQSLPGTGTMSRTASSLSDLAPGSAAEARVPGGLPAELADRLHPALAVLVRVQAERGGEIPTLRGVALALVAHPLRDHLAIAHELEHWALAGGGRNRVVKDWVRTYRTFLSGAPDAAPVRVRGGSAPLGAAAVAHTGDLARFDRDRRRGR